MAWSPHFLIWHHKLIFQAETTLQGYFMEQETDTDDFTSDTNTALFHVDCFSNESWRLPPAQLRMLASISVLRMLHSLSQSQTSSKVVHSHCNTEQWDSGIVGQGITMGQQCPKVKDEFFSYGNWHSGPEFIGCSDIQMPSLFSHIRWVATLRWITERIYIPKNVAVSSHKSSTQWGSYDPDQLC
jgi:hypothetical protein